MNQLRQVSHVLCMAVALAATALAQQTAPASPATASVPAGPTMAETTTWLKNDGLAFLHSHKSNFDRSSGVGMSTDAGVTELDIENCTLKLVHFEESTLTSRSSKNAVTKTTYRDSVPLKDLDVPGILVRDDTILADVPVKEIKIATRAAIGKTIDSLNERGAGKYSGLILPVDSLESGQRVVAALRRAAVLCGAPSSPF